MNRVIVLSLWAVACGDPCEESGTICTVMGNGVAGVAAEGAKADESSLYWPADVTLDPQGTPYVVDWNNHRLLALPQDDEGALTVHRITGNSMIGDGPWNAPASTAFWNHPTNIAFDTDGTFVFAGWHNSRVLRVDPVADYVTLEGGNGSRSFVGDGGLAVDAGFDLPSSVAFAEDGTLYVSDQANQRIRAIDTDGFIQTVVGTGDEAFAGDGGPAIDACLHSETSQNAEPAGRIVISGSTMYIADTSNQRIRTVDMDSWIIDTFVGGGTGIPVEGEGLLETSILNPRDVAVAPNGDVYFADSDHGCIRVVRGDSVETVAGVCGELGYDGDGGPASEAILNRPYGIDMAPDGALWIADTYNHAIRRVTP